MDAKLKAALTNPEIANELLRRLDAVATNFDHYEYGLPTFDEGAAARMREEVYRWLIKLEELQAQQ